MLQQIFNITLNSDLNKSKKFQRYRDSQKSSFVSRGKANDTASISAASQFLSKLDWQITNLEFESKKKFVISFETGGYLFHLEVDPNDFISSDKLNLEIIKVLDDSKEMVMMSSAPYNILQQSVAVAKIELEYIPILFTRLKYLVDDNKVMNVNEGFYEDLTEGLNREIGDICSLILSLAEKLLGVEIWPRLKSIININFSDKITIYNVKIR